ncbi:hypothetical protein Syn7502_01619 [Synechococcus sp. PCC 7502]|uniref:PRC-barrel domain-containing protein n=1 Tax=Synechococcus sp. PCC 7502 TaxID=1173263 RepID=UPI00029F9CA5|nr:PRC-barrel domain-containing protein [Synechococcus sp. PCC 7502]AFY73675.1 hypothetical protein Syn7502_01619 [Synechococcus sp. PCC 7502]
MITSDSILQRAAILGTQVISKSSAKRLGIVTQIWLDVDQRRVMGLSVAERFLPGTAIGIGEDFYMSLERVSLLGEDAILVDDEDVLEDLVASDRYTNLMGNEVVTESGELLGKVRDFKFDPATGDLFYLILSAMGNPLIPAVLVSTYELDVNEIIAVGRDRIIVTEGMEERLTQLTKGVLERLGLGKPPWEQEFEDEYLPPASVSGNALGSGLRGGNVYRPQRSPERPVYRREEAWDDDDNWADERTPVQPARRQSRVQPVRDVRPDVRQSDIRQSIDEDYDDYDEDDNWSNRQSRSIPQQPRRSANIQPKPQNLDPYEDDVEDDVKDVWAEEPKKIRQRQEEIEEI